MRHDGLAQPCAVTDFPFPRLHSHPLHVHSTSYTRVMKGVSSESRVRSVFSKQSAVLRKGHQVQGKRLVPGSCLGIKSCLMSLALVRSAAKIGASTLLSKYANRNGLIPEHIFLPVACLHLVQILTTPMPKMPEGPLVKFERAEDNPGTII